MIRVGRTLIFLSLGALLATAGAGQALAFHRGDPSAGEKVFNETCIKCHGADGKGAVEGAPDFTKFDTRLKKSDEVLLEHILNGFQEPGNPLAMPAKGGNESLTTKDLADALAYLRERFEYMTYAAAGEKIYEETCIACHGEEGEGVVPGAPDFTKSDGVLMKADSVLLEHILDGFQEPGKPMAMPSKGGNEDLTIRDVMTVLDYLHVRFHYKTYP